MDRVPEPELMDAPAQARAYAEADFTVAHEQVVTLLRRRFPAAHPRRVVDLGCGPGDVTWRVARAWPDALVTGVDGALAMLAEGRRLLAGRGGAERIAFVAARLPCTPFRRHAFDAVVSNSLLHHLSDARVLWDAASTLGVPGAPVLVVDLHRPPSRAAADVLVRSHAGGEPEVLRHDFFRSLLAAYTVAEVQAQLAACGLVTFDVEAVGDRHLVAWGNVPDHGA